jgi:hypothetical protein
MRAAPSRLKQRPAAAAVTTKAFLRAGLLLRIPQAALARIVGVSEPTMSRVAAGGRTIDPQAKEGELALLFLRGFRSLDALFGGNHEQSRLWLRAANRHLGGTPLEMVQTLAGLIHVVEYLDGMRGQG